MQTKTIFNMTIVIGSAHLDAINAAKKTMQKFPSIHSEFIHIPFTYTENMSERRAHEISYCKYILAKEYSKYKYDYVLFRDSDVYIPYLHIVNATKLISDQSNQVVNYPYVLRSVYMKTQQTASQETVPLELFGCYIHHKKLIMSHDYINQIYKTHYVDSMLCRTGAPDSNISKYLMSDGVKNIRAEKILSRHYVSRDSYNEYSHGAIKSVINHSTFVNIGMAVIPSRLSNLKKSIPILAQQADAVYVHINNYNNEDISFLSNIQKVKVTVSTENYGDAMKFKMIDSCTPGYYFSVDDDILYPIDYVAKMRALLQLHSNNIIACVHGSTFDPHLPVAGFINRRKMYDFREELKINTKVIMGGTGTVAFHTDRVQVKLADFKKPNMADIWLMCYAAVIEYGIIAINRKQNWLQQMSTGTSTIEHARPLFDMESAVQKYQPELKRTYKLLGK